VSISSLQSRVSSLQSPRRPRSGRRGFTLIEILVVLLILGLVAGLVGLMARPHEGALLRVEAERLARLIDLAIAESGLTGRSIAWAADDSGYRFWRLREDTGWLEIRDGDTLRARRLPHGMTISAMRVENGGPPGAVRLVFDPYGPPPPFVIELALGAERYSVAGSAMGEVRATQSGGGTDG
jgi:general secretion pathway protein H